RHLRRPPCGTRLRPHSRCPQQGQAAGTRRTDLGQDRPFGRSAGRRPRRCCGPSPDRKGAARGCQRDGAGQQRRDRHPHHAAGKRCREDGGDGSVERYRADAPDLRRGAGLRCPWRRHGDQHRLDRRGCARTAQRRLWRHQGLRAGLHHFTQSRTGR
ncbi:hypothetical protein OY671_011959, partial [Metschnikowia pulcherrima]